MLLIPRIVLRESTEVLLEPWMILRKSTEMLVEPRLVLREVFLIFFYSYGLFSIALAGVSL